MIKSKLESSRSQNFQQQNSKNTYHIEQKDNKSKEKTKPKEKNIYEKPAYYQKNQE